MRLLGADLNVDIFSFLNVPSSFLANMIQGHRHRSLFISNNKADLPLILKKNNTCILYVGQVQPTFQPKENADEFQFTVERPQNLSSRLPSCWAVWLPPRQAADISYYSTFLSRATSWIRHLF